MTVEPQVFTEAVVRTAVTMADAIESARRAFAAVAQGEVVNPFPWSLEIAAQDGEVHVKGAHLQGSPLFAIKTATGFPRNILLGQPTSGGFTSVFDAMTGQLRAVLLDNGYLTELRTGAAGALALDLLSSPVLDTVSVIGTGGQARHQVDGILAVRRPSRVVLVGRNLERADAFAATVRERTDVNIVTSTDIEESVRKSDAIITVTSSREPLIRREWVAKGAHITAIGSDAPGKRELESKLVYAADVVVADDTSQSRRLGELQGIGDDVLKNPAISLGDLLIGRARGRSTAADLTIADLSGLGVQDATIAEAALRALTTTDLSAPPR